MRRKGVLNESKSSLVSSCQHAWNCCPTWLQFFLWFVIGNIIMDLAAFPLVHTFWNILNFEGWYID